MIRVTVLFPNEEGVKFDFDYWRGKHLENVASLIGDTQLTVEQSRGLGGLNPEDPMPYVAVANMLFDSMEELQSLMAKAGEELMADIPNFTNVMPVVQISEVLE